eukprot:TRINITY_DN2140_c0_g3_i1.p1 TRINITY_DN2140_c0_g3~~TRINITY_DN2140_c0_g3_i1.p1  ORF type:complete len:834 (+),score=240.66 TRINITY_DN2140_c0_g3_i1:46-2502(+)
MHLPVVKGASADAAESAASQKAGRWYAAAAPGLAAVLRVPQSWCAESPLLPAPMPHNSPLQLGAVLSAYSSGGLKVSFDSGELPAVVPGQPSQLSAFLTQPEGLDVGSTPQRAPRTASRGRHSRREEGRTVLSASVTAAVDPALQRRQLLWKRVCVHNAFMRTLTSSLLRRRAGWSLAKLFVPLYRRFRWRMAKGCKRDGERELMPKPEDAEGFKLQVLSSRELFSEWPRELLRSLSAEARLSLVLPDDFACYEGEECGGHLIVCKGLVDAWSRANGQTKCVRAREGRLVLTLGPGDGFGEIALFGELPKLASLLAKEASVLLHVSTHSFLAHVETLPAAVQEKVHADATKRHVCMLKRHFRLQNEHVRGNALLQQLSDADLDRLVDAAEPVVVPQGAVVYRAGDRATRGCGIVTRGRVELIPPEGSRWAERRTVAPGELFGDDELVFLQDREHDAVTRQAAEVWWLPRAALHDALLCYPSHLVNFCRLRNKKAAEVMSRRPLSVELLASQCAAQFAAVPQRLAQALRRGFAQAAKPRVLSAGESVATRGQPCDKLILLVRGTLKSPQGEVAPFLILGLEESLSGGRWTCTWRAPAQGRVYIWTLRETYFRGIVDEGDRRPSVCASHFTAVSFLSKLRGVAQHEGTAPISPQVEAARLMLQDQNNAVARSAASAFLALRRGRRSVSVRSAADGQEESTRESLSATTDAAVAVLVQKAMRFCPSRVTRKERGRRRSAPLEDEWLTDDEATALQHALEDKVKLIAAQRRVSRPEPPRYAARRMASMRRLRLPAAGAPAAAPDGDRSGAEQGRATPLMPPI